MTSSKYGGPKLWVIVSSRVHICIREYGQLITTCVCANSSEINARLSPKCSLAYSNIQKVFPILFLLCKKNFDWPLRRWKLECCITYQAGCCFIVALYETGQIKTIWPNITMWPNLYYIQFTPIVYGQWIIYSKYNWEQECIKGEFHTKIFNSGLKLSFGVVQDRWRNPIFRIKVNEPYPELNGGH